MTASAVLGLTNTASAGIVYTNPPDLTLNGLWGVGERLIDIDGDGTSDFRIFKRFSIVAYQWYDTYKTVGIQAYGANQIAVSPAPVIYDLGFGLYRTENIPHPLTSGQTIDSNATWEGGQHFLARNAKDRWTTYQVNVWYNLQNRYVGITLDINGSTHYGWIRLSVYGYHDSVTIHDFAFENLPNTPIQAGATGIAPYPPVTQLWESHLLPKSVRLNWLPTPGAHHFIIRGKRKFVNGQPNPIWSYISNNIAGNIGFLDIAGLTSHETYEWEVLANYDSLGTLSGGWSTRSEFYTDCYGPDNIWVDPLTNNTAILNWLPVQGVAGYSLIGREMGGQWHHYLVSPNNTFKMYPFLPASTAFEWKIKSWCDSNFAHSSAWVSDSFATPAVQRMGQDFVHEVTEPPIQNPFYPNPNEGDVYLSDDVMSTLSANAVINIRDLKGDIISTFEGNMISKKLELHHVSSGMYFIEIISNQQQVFEKLIIH